LVGKWTGYDFDNELSDDMVVAKEILFCSGNGTKCTPNPESTNKRAKGCSFRVKVIYFAKKAQIWKYGDHGPNFKKVKVPTYKVNYSLNVKLFWCNNSLFLHCPRSLRVEEVLSPSFF